MLGLAIDAELLLSLAEEFPDQLFGAPSDVFAETLPDNVAAFQINVHESSFLVGVIAGMMTESKIVGAVVGGDAPALNQAFDVTPNELISGLITEAGIAKPPYASSLKPWKRKKE